MWQLICGATTSKNGIKSCPKFCGTRGGRKADANNRIPDNGFVEPLISASLYYMSASCCGSRGGSSCTRTHCVAWLSILDKESASVLVVPCLYIILNLYSCSANDHLKSRPGGRTAPILVFDASICTLKSRLKFGNQSVADFVIRSFILLKLTLVGFVPLIVYPSTVVIAWAV